MQNADNRSKRYHAVGDPGMYWTKYDLENILDEYRTALGECQRLGWDTYVLTVEFGKLHSKEERQVEKMARAVTRLHAAISNEFVGESGLTSRLDRYAPVGIFFPNLPRRCLKARPTTIECGSLVGELHMRGVLTASPWKGRAAFLDECIAKHSDKCTKGTIRKITFECIDRSDDPIGAIEYIFDGLRERVFIPDDILVLDLGALSQTRLARPSFDVCAGYDGYAAFEIAS